MDIEDRILPLKEIKIFEGEPPYTEVLIYSPNGEYIVAGSFYSNKLIIWNSKSGKIINTIISKDDETHIFDISKDSKYIALASFKDITIFDIISGQKIIDLKVDNQCIMSIKFSPKGNLISCLYEGNNIKIWDSNSFSEICILNSGTTGGGIAELVFSPDGKYLLETNDSINIWDLEKKEIIKKLNHFAVSLDFSLDGKWLITGVMSCGDDESIKIWDAKSWNQLRIVSEEPMPGDSPDIITSVQFSLNNKYIVASYLNTLKIFDFKSGKLLRKFSSKTIKSALSPDGKYIIYNENEVIKMFEFDIPYERNIRGIWEIFRPVN